MKRWLFLSAIAVAGCRYWYSPVPVANAIGEEKAVLAGDTLRVYRETRFEVYGPDEQSVYDGYEQLDQAYRAFEHHFGTEAPHLAVLLAKDTSLVIDSATRTAFAARGLAFVRYVRTHEEYVRYGALAYGGELWPVAPTAARAMLAKFAETQLPHDSITSDSATLARFPVWYRAAVMHLIGEEGAISNDLEYLRDQRSAWMNLQDLLTLVRPPGEDAMLDPSRRDDADPLSRIVGAQSSAVAQFLVEKDGPQVMRRLAQGYATGHSVVEILRELPSMSHGMTQFEQSWRVWVATEDR